MTRTPRFAKATGRTHASAAAIFFSRLMAARATAAWPVESCQQPPATVLPQVFDLHCQMPPANRLMLSLPQKEHRYRARCEISYFFTIFLKDAPYRVPYLPVMPTFLVCLAIASGWRHDGGARL